ncbi:hypothetical protein ScPMuIL_017934 [Solemya velum]
MPVSRLITHTMTSSPTQDQITPTPSSEEDICSEWAPTPKRPGTQYISPGPRYRPPSIPSPHCRRALTPEDSSTLLRLREPLLRWTSLSGMESSGN